MEIIKEFSPREAFDQYQKQKGRYSIKEIHALLPEPDNKPIPLSMEAFIVLKTLDCTGIRAICDEHAAKGYSEVIFFNPEADEQGEILADGLAELLVDGLAVEESSHQSGVYTLSPLALHAEYSLILERRPRA